MTKKNELPPALVELICDPETRRAEIQLLGLAQELVNEGMPLRSAARGLAGAIISLIEQEYPKGNEEFIWAWHFLRELQTGFGEWRENLELIDDMADAIQRSRASGGGSPYQ
ncbi:TPA: hypothetical protein N2C61_006470 [Pseudomonas aeruginosa]|uniref:hypothetical protein n=1 Tax=Alcaligenes xylosoxydans xylosoxydans TaxID=85698 RepID=UPI0005F8E34E|nr:hypothetical protein [Achromobacter xylosoxidans]HCL4135305.1 hypothetical protein [Pseudomonas aeruginosa]